MSFENLMLLPLIIIFLVAYIFWYATSEKKFFLFIRDHWFFRRTWTHKISTFFYLIGISGIVLSLLDVRGPEELVKGEMNVQRTILLIDTSQSMLAEDVRPSRYKKAILLARHFVKNAVGHQISVIVFSDGVKRIVPFTADVDLLDARLQALEAMDLKHGGTALGAALNESVQYFRTSESMIGNILLFTDAENNEAKVDMKFPDDVSLGVIGIGTARGGPIPERDRNGNLIGNKRFKGEVVITKLDEIFLKELGKDVKNYRFWIGTSYSLPTSEILSFFNQSYKDKLNENQFRVKPILTHYLLIPSLVVFTFAMLLRLKGALVAGLMMFFLFSNSDAYAQEKEPPQKTERIKELENEFHLGKGTDAKKLELAQEYLHAGFYPEAKILYTEALSEKDIAGNELSFVNYATTLLAIGELKEGLELSRKVESFLDKNSLFDPLDKLKHNIVFALNNSSSGGEGQEQSQNNDENESEDNQDQSSDDSKGEGKGDNKEQNKDQDGQDSQDQNDKKDQDGDQDKEDEKDQQDSKDPKDKDQKDNNDKKMPSLLKQLISDDNKLQKQLIDAKTQGRGDRDKKDW